MNAIFQFQVRHSSNRWVLGLTGLILLFIGLFAGYKFNLTAGEGIYLNSPYTIGFMVALLSLSIIFLAILFALEILYKEWDSNFDIILFSYPVSLKKYLIGKFSFFAYVVKKYNPFCWSPFSKGFGIRLELWWFLKYLVLHFSSWS
mgnify:CR=1 FL=1